MIVGGYVMHCYCATCNKRGEPRGVPQVRLAARRDMLKQGWKFRVVNYEDECWCPDCKPSKASASKARVY